MTAPAFVPAVRRAARAPAALVIPVAVAALSACAAGPTAPAGPPPRATAPARDGGAPGADSAHTWTGGYTNPDI